MFDLGGKKALVTAASSGIGEAVAGALAGSGADVLISSSNSGRIADAAERISAKTGKKPAWKTCDMKKRGDADALAEFALERLGGIDFLIVNYGDPRLAPFLDLSLQDWDDSINMFVGSTASLVRRIAPVMSPGGRIVFITSMTTRQAAKGFSLSGSLRAAVVNLGKIMSLELAPKGITVNSISQGYFQTKRLQGVLERNARINGTTVGEELEAMKSRVPLGRIGKPEEIGHLVCFLCSSEAGYINGANIPIDGGVSLYPY